MVVFDNLRKKSIFPQRILLLLKTNKLRVEGAVYIYKSRVV